MVDHGLDTIVAGVRCRDVLAELSDYLDGTVPVERVGQLQAHLASCDRCAQFGGHIATTLAQLRSAMPIAAANGPLGDRIMAAIVPA